LRCVFLHGNQLMEEIIRCHIQQARKFWWNYVK